MHIQIFNIEKLVYDSLKKQVVCIEHVHFFFFLYRNFEIFPGTVIEEIIYIWLFQIFTNVCSL